MTNIKNKNEASITKDMERESANNDIPTGGIQPPMLNMMSACCTFVKQNILIENTKICAKMHK